VIQNLIHIVYLCQVEVNLEMKAIKPFCSRTATGVNSNSVILVVLCFVFDVVLIVFKIVKTVVYRSGGRLRNMTSQR